MRHDLARVGEVGSCRSRGALRRLRARSLAAAAAGLAAAGLAAGCGSAAAPGTGSASRVTGQVTIAAVPGLDSIPVFLAQQEGLFTKAGLSRIVVRRYSSATAELAALNSGQADIAASDYGDIFLAQARRKDLRVLADGYDASPGVMEVMTWPGSPVRTPANLKNQSVAAPDDDLLATGRHPVSLGTAAAAEVLGDYFPTLQTAPVTWVPMSQQQEVAGLESHHLQAALLGQPYIAEAESQVGAVEVLDAYSASTQSMPLSGYVATSSWVARNSAAVADFRSAIARAKSQASSTAVVDMLLPKIDPGVTQIDANLASPGSYPASTSVTALQRVVRLLWNSPWSRQTFQGLSPPEVTQMVAGG